MKLNEKENLNIYYIFIFKMKIQVSWNVSLPQYPSREEQNNLASVFIPDWNDR